MSNQETSLVKISEWNSLLTERVDQIAEAIFKPEMAVRLIKLALTAMSRQPLLMHCTKESILLAIIEMGQLGLEPGALGQCYLIPFYNKKKKTYEAVFMPGYRGLIKLARDSGAVTNITAEVVYEHDEFDYRLGLKPMLHHKPILTDSDEERGEIKYFYAIAWAKEGPEIFEVMSKEQVDGIRKRSKAATQGPWVTDYIEMGRKTVIKRITKKLDLSPELEAAIGKDNALEAGEDPRLAVFHPQFGEAPEPVYEPVKPKTDQVLDMLDEIEVEKVPERSEEEPEEKEPDIFEVADDRAATTSQIEAVRSEFANLCKEEGVGKTGKQEELLMSLLNIASFEAMTGEMAKRTIDDIKEDRQSFLDWIQFQIESEED